jgi:DsbC/DsbD-like thiol-disulfide interchange protein
MMSFDATACARIFALAASLMASIAAWSGSALAETTGWATNEGGRMRLIALAPDGRGVVRGGLQIEPKAGWITYWRDPGDAGIPPSISFDPSSGIEIARMSYPVPKRIDNGPLRDVGYDGAVTFPFELKITDPPKALHAKAEVFIGLCRNICIPFQAQFTLALAPDSGTSFAEAMILNEADATLPEAPSPDFTISHYAVTGGTLALKLRLPADAPKKPKVIVTGPEGHVLFNDAEGEWENGLFSVDMPIGKLPSGYDMDGKHWGILVLCGQRAMETTLAF